MERSQQSPVVGRLAVQLRLAELQLRRADHQLRVAVLRAAVLRCGDDVPALAIAAPLPAPPPTAGPPHPRRRGGLDTQQLRRAADRGNSSFDSAAEHQNKLEHDPSPHTMSDSSRRPPPFGTKKPRMQRQDERDAEGFAARKERERERDGTVKELAGEEITGRYEGEELEERRRLRPPDERFSRLESKHDDLKRDVDKKHDDLKGDIKEVRDELKGDVKDVRTDVKDLSGHVGDLRKDVGGVGGKLEGQEKVLTEMLGIVKKSAERDHVTFTAKVDIDKANELAKVEVSKAEGLAKVEVTKEHDLDTVEARKVRRDTIAKIAGGVLGGGGLVELLHRLGVL